MSYRVPIGYVKNWQRTLFNPSGQIGVSSRGLNGLGYRRFPSRGQGYQFGSPLTNLGNEAAVTFVFPFFPPDESGFILSDGLGWYKLFYYDRTGGVGAPPAWASGLWRSAHEIDISAAATAQDVRDATHTVVGAQTVPGSGELQLSAANTINNDEEIFRNLIPGTHGNRLVTFSDNVGGAPATGIVTLSGDPAFAGGIDPLLAYPALWGPKRALVPTETFLDFTGGGGG